MAIISVNFVIFRRAVLRRMLLRTPTTVAPTNTVEVPVAALLVLLLTPKHYATLHV